MAPNGSLRSEPVIVRDPCRIGKSGFAAVLISEKIPAVGCTSPGCFAYKLEQRNCRLANFGIQTEKASGTMINLRPILAVAITAFAIGCTLLIGGVVLQILGVPNAITFMMPGLAFNYVGVLGIWVWRTAKEQTERLDRLEAQLLAQGNA